MDKLTLLRTSSSIQCIYRPANIIVPVYRGVSETRKCLESLLSSDLPDDCQITLIDDCGPDDEMPDLLEGYAKHSHVTVLKNEKNIGFVASVNRGMEYLPNHDPVLLNADTLVPVGWIQRLRRSLYAAPDIGTVTPFSNNATICSYPRFCQDNSIPPGMSMSSLDRMFQRANAMLDIEIPTAVGFCMLIRRECLAAVGLFDVQLFGRGYGEENDFCMRATAEGWKHMLCGSTFVYHSGAVSFAGEHDARVREALGVMEKQHPGYSLQIRKHVLSDPAARLRNRVDLTRLTDAGLPVILVICHDLGGGVIRHVYEVARQFAGKAEFLLLRAAVGHQIELSWCRELESMRLYFHRQRDWSELCSFIESAGVVRMHFHHWLGLPDDIWNLPRQCSLPYDITIHDYHTICPRINLVDHSGSYCGEPDDDGCNSCLCQVPRITEGIVPWRGQWHMRLTGAVRVLTPSHDVAERLRRYFPDRSYTVAPHPDIVASLPSPAPSTSKHNRNRPFTVLVIGALSRIKGGATLEACAIDAAKRDLPFHFALIGYAWRPLLAPADFLSVTGEYKDEDLPQMIESIDPDIIWFPALWPETYSYTLSAALKAARPIVVTDLGALTERIGGRQWSWVGDWRWGAREWNDFFVKVREQNFLTARPPNPIDRPCTPTDWNWESDYLLVEYKLATRDLDKLLFYANAHSWPRLAYVERFLFAVRRATFLAALRLRRHPWSGRLISLVPAELQHRLRRWVLGSLN